jgi:hypothetical protein
MGLFTQSHSRIDRYRELRAAGKQLVSKMFAAARAPQYDIVKAAKKLTLPVHDRTLIFDGETDTSALPDFFLHEMRYGGRRIVDLLEESQPDLTDDERALLAAHRVARCSLFQVSEINPADCQVKLHDLLDSSDPDPCLTDISYSNCGAAHPGDLIFTRLLHCDGISMTSGFFFGFVAVHRFHLLNAYAARISTVEQKEKALRKFVFFYQKNRELGAEQAYQDVASEPSSRCA